MKRFTLLSLAVVVLVGASVCEGRLGRQLQAYTQYDTEIEVPNHPNEVSERNSYLPESSRNSQLPKRSVYCQPDANGFYGTTSGRETVVIFGYGVETSPGTIFSDVFQAVQGAVERVLLAHYFPTLCNLGTSRRRHLRITGFVFDTDWRRYAGPCTPLLDDNNSCRMYEGTLRVYGSGEDPLSVIRDFLDLEGTEDIHSGVQRIFSVDLVDGAFPGLGENRKKMGDKTKDSANVQSVSSEGSEGMGSAAIVGISVTTVILVLGVAVLAYFEVRRRKASNLSQPLAASDEEQSDRSSGSQHSGLVSVDLQSGSLTLDGGRPTAVDGGTSTCSSLVLL